MDSKWHGLCEGIATIGTGPKDVKETLNIKVFFSVNIGKSTILGQNTGFVILFKTGSSLVITFLISTNIKLTLFVLI